MDTLKKYQNRARCAPKSKEHQKVPKSTIDSPKKTPKDSKTTKHQKNERRAQEHAKQEKTRKTPKEKFHKLLRFFIRNNHIPKHIASSPCAFPQFLSVGN